VEKEVFPGACENLPDKFQGAVPQSRQEYLT